MSCLEKNIEKLEIKGLENLNIGDIELNIEKVEVLSAPDFNKNRSLFIAYDIYDYELIKEISDNLNEKSLLMLYYRKEEEMLKFLSVYDFTCFDKVIVLYGDQRDSAAVKRLHTELGNILYAFTNIQPIIKVTENVEYVKSAKELLKAIRLFRENFMFMVGNNLNDTLYGIRNRLINLPKYIENPGLLELKNKYGKEFKNKPVVIVSTGPSLDKNVHLLKDYQDNVFIFSCDASQKALAKHGIVPDVVGSVERVLDVYNLFYKDKKLNPSTVMASPAVIRPEVIDNIDNKFISFFKDRELYGVWMDELALSKKGRIFTGSSVAHSLLNVAIFLECSPIILIGQDLAYSGTGYSHSVHMEAGTKIDLDNVDVWVEDYNGNQIPSTSVWRNFLMTFEDIIRDTKAKVIDATEGGAYIRGSEVATLQDTLEKFAINKKESVREMVDAIEISNEYVSAALDNSHKGICEMIDLFKGLMERVNKGIKLNKKGIDIFNKGINTQRQLDNIYDSFEFIDEDIVKHIAASPYLMMLFQYPIHKAIGEINQLGTDQYTIESIRANLLIHYDLLATMDVYSRKAIKVLTNGIKTIEESLKNVDIEYKSLDISEFKKWINSNIYDIEMI